MTVREQGAELVGMLAADESSTTGDEFDDALAQFAIEAMIEVAEMLHDISESLAWLSGRRGPTPPGGQQQ